MARIVTPVVGIVRGHLAALSDVRVARRQRETPERHRAIPTVVTLSTD
jgi:hypothetical protein